MMGGVCLALLAHPRQASAHLLDAYLQAAQISIDPQQVTLDLYLTPGVQIAPGVLEAIDLDHGGSVSAAEVQQYAESILPKLTLAVDGKPLTMQLTASDSPPVEELRQGVGPLHLKAVAQLPRLGDGPHIVSFRNTFRPAGSLYLANAMLPRDQRIVIREQNRDQVQSTIDITYDLRATKAEIFVRTAAALFAALTAWAAWWLAILRRRRARANVTA